MQIVIASNVTKRFGKRDAITTFDLEVHVGQCYGLLGPPESGKSTVFYLLAGLEHPTSGQIKVFGMDAKRFGRNIRQALGVVPQQNNLDPELSLFENLTTYASYFGIKRSTAQNRAEELLDYFSLGSWRHELPQKVPPGTDRLAMIARGLITNPQLLLLDEPTQGMDAATCLQVWRRLNALKQQPGLTSILATRSILEAETLCDRLSLLDKGKTVETGLPIELVKQYAGDNVVELFDLGDQARDLLQHFQHKYAQAGIRAKAHQDIITFYLPPSGRSSLSFLDEVRRQKIPHTVRRASLEDAVLHLFGRDMMA